MTTLILLSKISRDANRRKVLDVKSIKINRGRAVKALNQICKEEDVKLSKKQDLYQIFVEDYAYEDFPSFQDFLKALRRAVRGVK
jgi:hypothetical protein